MLCETVNDTAVNPHFLISVSTTFAALPSVRNLACVRRTDGHVFCGHSASVGRGGHLC